MVSDAIFNRIRREITYFRKKSEQMKKESSSLEKVITFNKNILENNMRELDESAIIIETMRRLIK